MNVVRDEPSWADLTLEDEAAAAAAAAAATGHDDAPVTKPTAPSWDDWLRQYPVPGELFVHLFGHANYLTGLIASHPPPAVGEPPVLVNQWAQVPPEMHSPFRIQYGLANPAMRGLVLTAHAMVPHFSWTPRLMLGSQDLLHLAQGDPPPPPGMLVLPAVHGDVVRLFHSAGQWFIAGGQAVEPLPDGGEATGDGVLTTSLRECLCRYYARSLHHFTAELAPALCWFFALYPRRQTMLFLGSCRVLPLSALTGHDRDAGGLTSLDAGFSLHSHLPPAVPILPEHLPPGSLRRLAHERLHQVVATPGWADLYDGLLLVNTRTLFAVRLCYPAVVFLQPLLSERVPLPEFLALRLLEAAVVDETHMPSVDHDSMGWARLMVEWVEALFGFHHGPLVDRLQWHVGMLTAWLPAWLGMVAGLAAEGWNQLDADLQRLFVLLDYEHPGDWWPRILSNPKYRLWLAKAVVWWTNLHAPEEAS